MEALKDVEERILYLHVSRDIFHLRDDGLTDRASRSFELS